MPTTTPQSSFTSLVQGKCPQCRQGKVFKYAPYHLKFSTMNDDCAVCGLHFEIEPGFFWGSMYISYGLTVIITLIVALIIHSTGHHPIPFYLETLLAVLLILSPPLFRYSRLIMLYLFGSISFNPQASQKH